MSNDIGYAIERHIESEVETALEHVSIAEMVETCIEEYDFSTVIRDAVGEAAHEYLEYNLDEAVSNVDLDDQLYEKLDEMFDDLGSERILSMLKRGLVIKDNQVSERDCQISDLKRMNSDLVDKLRDLSLEQINSRIPDVCLETALEAEKKLKE